MIVHLALLVALAQNQVIRIENKPLVEGRISPYQYGQFIEYLCNLVPGMWAEKLYDGNFEGLSPYKFWYIRETDNREKPWYPIGAVNRIEFTLDKSEKINGESSGKIATTGTTPCQVGIAQDGIAVQRGETLRFHAWLKVSSPATVSLTSGAKTLAKAALPLGEGWHAIETTLKPNETTANATLKIEFRGPGVLKIDAASLMPTNSIGGWRPDVVKALRELKPGIIRVGGSVMDDPNLGSFEWAETVGDPDRRVPFRSWGGLQPTGAGLEEIVQLCQAVGAEPLICVRVRAKTPKDAADEVEYFNGAASTPMGAMRAKNGHAEPYHIKFWQVGNEQWGDDYWHRLPGFCEAMKAVDPSIRLMSSFPAPAVLEGSAKFLDFICPHHYECENLVGENQDFADVRKLIAQYPLAKNIKVGVTEWNTTAGDIGLRRAKLWTLENALACARYHNLMHRNADLVEIANRSNLTNSFCSGIIQTDSARMYLTPTYYAQKLYSNLAGTIPLAIGPPALLTPGLDTSATLSEDGHTVTLFVVNPTAHPESRDFDLSAFHGQLGIIAHVWTLRDSLRAGEPDVTNSFDFPSRVVPVESSLPVQGSKLSTVFEKLSLTVIQFRV